MSNKMMHMHSFENDSVYLTLSETWHLFYILYFWVAYNTRNLTDKMHFWISHLVKFSWFLEPWVVSLQLFLQREISLQRVHCLALPLPSLVFFAAQGFLHHHPHIKTPLLFVSHSYKNSKKCFKYNVVDIFFFQNI